MTAKTATTTLLVLTATLVAVTPIDPKRTEAFRFLRAYDFLRDSGESLLSDNATSLRRALSLPFARKWPKTRLTWNFQVASEELLRTTEAAFALWAASSSLKFARDSIHPDILILYRMGAHTYANRENGDICPAIFESPGGGLAHAFFPTGAADFASEVHVDDEEPWHVLLTNIIYC
ncbi:hypothetical protein ACFW04_012226 [Cataglyphis niger]